MATVRKITWTYKGKEKSAYQVTYTDPLTKKRPTKNFKLFKVADAYRLRVEREIEDGTHTAAGRTKTVKDVCEAFLQQMRVRLKEGRIGPDRLELVKRFLSFDVIPEIGGVPFSDLSLQMVEKVYSRLIADDRMMPYVARQRIGLLKQVEDYARRREWTQRSVVSTISSDLRGLEKPEQKRFTTEEVITILKKVGDRRYRTTDRRAALMCCYVNIAAFCGLRFGEICALRHENINYADGVLHVRKNLTARGVLKSTKSKAGNRDVPMPQHVGLLIKDWIDNHGLPNEAGLIFTTRTGKRQQSSPFHQAWHPLLDSVGLRPTDGEDYHHFHGLRSFAASWWVKNGAPLTTASKWMGHAKPDMTLEFYARSLDTSLEQREMADRMALRLLSPAKVIETRPS